MYSAHHRPFTGHYAALLLLIMMLVVVLLPQQLSRVYAGSTDESEPNATFASADGIGIGYENYINASISSSSDVDYFQFTVTSGRTYVVETYNVAKTITSNAMELWIYNNNLSEVASDTGNRSDGAGNTDASVSFTASSSGTYYAKVEPYYYSAGSGSYYIRVLPKYDEPGAGWDANFEPNNWAANAYAISVGYMQSLTSTIEARGTSYNTTRADRDWYRFDAVAGRTYVIESLQVASNITSRAMELWVYDSNLNKVASDTGNRSDGAGNTDASVSFTASSSGVYYIEIQPYYYAAGSGTYSLRVLPKYDEPGAGWDANFEPNNWAANAYAISVGYMQSLTSTIEARGTSYNTTRADRDWYRFDAVAGRTYVIESLQVASNITSRAMELWVYDNNLNEIAEDTGNRSDGVGNTNASVSFTASSSGVYYIEVQPYYYDAGSGTYSLRVLPKYDEPGAGWDTNFEPNNWVANAYVLPIDPCGQTTTIEMRGTSYATDAADRDWFVFTATKNEQYVIELYDADAAFDVRAGSGGFNVRMYDQNQNLIREVDNNSSPALDLQATYDGVYYVMITPDKSEANGRYSLRIASSSNLTCSTLQATISGQITDSNNNPLAGVTVSDGTRTATTDSNGNYTLSNVPAGSYTLTPEKIGYTFTPTTHSVTVSDDVSGQDFTATATASPVTLESNVTTGAPGSVFVLAAHNFPPNSQAVISLKAPGMPTFKEMLRQTMDAEGHLVFLFLTGADNLPGAYTIRLTVQTATTGLAEEMVQETTITLADDAPQRTDRPAGDIPTVDVNALSGSIYLPLVIR